MSTPIKKVLIVDDDPTALLILRKIFEGLGCEVEAREQALGTSATLLGKPPPDLVVLDVEMPALRGDTLVGIMRKRWPNVFCVLFSSLPAEELEAARHRCGADAAVGKRSRPGELRSTFAALLSRAGRAG